MRRNRTLLSIGLIPFILQPRYSPDLNIIEHVWSWMKRYIQGRYFMAYYNAANIPLRTLKRIILEVWNAVPNSYIQALLTPSIIAAAA